MMLYRVGEGEDRETFFRELPARRKVDGCSWSASRSPRSSRSGWR